MHKTRRQISMIVSGAALALTLATPAAAKFKASDAARLDAEAAATLAQFTASTMGAEAVLAEAKGVLVCPKITKAGFGFGAEGGQCLLTTAAGEKLYYGTFGVKGGFIAGIQSHSMILALKTDEALAKFTTGQREWELGVDASVAVATVGAGGDVDTSNLKSDVVSFIFGQQGLMADASWKGSRFKRLDIE
ncbi:YSC84-related protein [Defluviimonas sp. D31]|uniref:lipid-binding SYLF domain-containing protein n=1 Tax=Defluviimonas sp. D31 TaxID=3083253 RepID=UPI00296E2FCB|nr:YSC84-related protein [Defluviimonas sp. D31]MDW4551320.1 YSC84-related protein [Defluviimonas sp. D31]